MTSSQIAEFCEVHDCAISCEFNGEDTRTYVVANEPYPGAHFACLRCGWQGEDPLWVDTADHFDPTMGEIPACPECRSISDITLIVPEEQLHAP